jgi:hypothetical protein
MMVIAILPKELGLFTGVVQLFLVGVQTITVFGEILNFSKVLTKVCCCCPCVKKRIKKFVKETKTKVVPSINKVKDIIDTVEGDVEGDAADMVKDKVKEKVKEKVEAKVEKELEKKLKKKVKTGEEEIYTKKKIKPLKKHVSMKRNSKTVVEL